MPKPPIAPARYVGPGLLVTPEMTRQEARSALSAAGFVFLSGGSFAGVVLAPEGDRVVRISKPDRGAEVAYAAFMGDLVVDEHTPRAYAFLRLADGGTVAEVERLHPPEDLPDGTGTRLTMAFFEDLAWKTGLTMDASRMDPYNWMMRKPEGTYVLTDPLADMRQHWNRPQSHLSLGRVRFADMISADVPLEYVGS